MASLTGTDPMLEAAIQAALTGPYHRIMALDLADGRKVWLKRAEHLTGRMRLQKGDGAKGFARERDGLHLLAQVGLPAAPILAEGPDWFVTPDLGSTLRQLMWDPEGDKTPVFAAAGAALARLHLQSYRHGRPAIRDFCWNGTDIHFIDLERFSPVKSDPRGLALDLLIFAHSLVADGFRVAGPVPLQEAALGAYRDLAPGIWAQAQTTAAWLRWLPPIARLKSGSRDFRAIGPTLELFRRDQG
ncbi:hypothetical protein EOK75_17575 (plasmid) [Pseudorhodobacter turbinis]|uniref:Serine/threonine protein phosphatase n=1 Tax=Pseudorhodobacter turbinis TaxID=2500533 RepID=A0A4P8EJZ9_9RHOB|nr:hypothetical protein [Pseudorhodobacter turbinis]QCO57520.1 hypothetical protein EOK75_17575 [Pseudorhodobacter turbinis]